MQSEVYNHTLGFTSKHFSVPLLHLCWSLLIMWDDSAIKIACSTTVFNLTFNKSCIMQDSITLVFPTKVRRKLDFYFKVNLEERKKKKGNSSHLGWGLFVLFWFVGCLLGLVLFWCFVLFCSVFHKNESGRAVKAWCQP